jgi:UDP-glucose 4-epimerase
MRYVITGGAGFIGSHLSDLLLSEGHDVTVYDNLRSGYTENLAKEVEFVRGDITSTGHLAAVLSGADGLFHLAAIARTPWCMEDPMLASITNSHGTACALEAARGVRTRRVVLASSNVVYAAHTPYRATKEMVELWTRTYVETYGLSALALRFSNVYGARQSEEGPSPNVFAAFRKSLRETGAITVTGDGEQSRDFTHVSDIAKGLLAAMCTRYTGEAVDLCTGKNWTMNQVCDMWWDALHPEAGYPRLRHYVKYVAERQGDVKHIRQSPERAFQKLGWSAKVSLREGIKDVL